MAQFSVGFYMFRDRDVIPDDDLAFIDFYDPDDKYNPFRDGNFISETKLESEGIEKAFSLVSLKWHATYGGDKFKYVYIPMDMHPPKKRATVAKWWTGVEAEISKAMVALGSDFYDAMA